MTRMTEGPLDAARVYLAERCAIADDADDRRERAILSPLADVADMVCRVGMHDASAHYQADKAGSMVTSALRVRCRALELYAGFEEDDRLDDILDLELKLDQAVSHIMWIVARGSTGMRVTETSARELREALHKLTAWSEKVTAEAVVDELDE